MKFLFVVSLQLTLW